MIRMLASHCLIQPVQVPRWLSIFASGIKTKFKDFRGEIYKKMKFTGACQFSTKELRKNYVQKNQRFRKMCCFGQNPRRKGNISLCNCDGKLPNILFISLCLCVRVLRVVAFA